MCDSLIGALAGYHVHGNPGRQIDKSRPLVTAILAGRCAVRQIIVRFPLRAETHDGRGLRECGCDC